MSKNKAVPDEPGKCQQYFTALIVCISSLSYGMSLGWVSPVLPRLLSPETPVGTEPMTEESASWLVGALCLGALFTTPILGPLSERFGRKVLGCLIAIPSIISWLLKIFAPNPNYLIVARFFNGVNAAGCLFLIPLYIAETTSNTIRGTAASLMGLLMNIGFLVSYIIGPILTFRVFAIVSLSVPVIYLGCFIFMPETPVYLVRKNKITEATKSLMWFKGKNNQAVEQELTHLRIQLKEASNSSASAKFSDLFKDRGTIKGLVIAIGLLGGQQTCGALAMLSYATTIFGIAGSSLSPDLSTVITGILQLVGSYLGTSFVECAGRKSLVLLSCALMCICHVILGVFCYYQSIGYDLAFIGWIPVVALSTFILGHTIGMGPIPYVVASEIFKPEIASLATTVSLFIMWFLLFMMVKFFSTVMALIGIANCFFILAGLCAKTFFFTIAFVPETKGRTIESIFDELNGNSRPRVEA